MLVRNKCCSCKHKWKDQPGGFATIKKADGKAYCPNCGSSYWKWSSYLLDKKKNKDKDAFGEY